MTKEEILKKLQIENPASISTFKAMDEWALQFGKWLQQCSYAPGTVDNKWQNQLPGENDIITTEELLLKSQQ